MTTNNSTRNKIQGENLFVTVYRRGNIASHIAVRVDKSKEDAVSYIEQHTADFNHPEDSSVELEVVDLSKGYLFSDKYDSELDEELMEQGLAEDYFEVDERDSKELGLKAGCYWVMNDQYVYNDNFFEEDLSTLFFGFPDF